MNKGGLKTEPCIMPDDGVFKSEFVQVFYLEGSVG